MDMHLFDNFIFGSSDEMIIESIKLFTNLSSDKLKEFVKNNSEMRVLENDTVTSIN